MSEITPEISQRFISARQGFDEFVQKVRKADPNIVDKKQIVMSANLSGVYQPQEFATFDEVQKEYEYLSEMSEDNPDDLLTQQINADRMLLRELTGEEVDFEEFGLVTTGFRPEKAPDEYIEERKSRLEELLQIKGMSYSPDSLPRFQEEFILTDPAVIKEEFEIGLALSRTVLGNYIPLPQDRLMPKFVNDPKLPYKGSLSTSPGGNFFMEANIAPVKRYIRPGIWQWVVHEDGGHVVHLATVRENIWLGEIDPASGVTAPHSPEVSYAETVTAFSESLLMEIAETDEEKWLTEFQTVYLELHEAVFHNALIMINTGTPEDDAVAYAVDHLPFESEDDLRSRLINVRDKPTYRAAFSVYFPARQLIKPVLDLESVEERKKIIVPLYSDLLSVGGLRKLIDTGVKDSKTYRPKRSLESLSLHPGR